MSILQKLSNIPCHGDIQTIKIHFADFQSPLGKALGLKGIKVGEYYTNSDSQTG